MRRWGFALVLLLAAACSDDTSDAEPPPSEFLEQFDDVIDRVETIGGVQVGIDDDAQVVYLADCELAEELTAAGGDYGPASETVGYTFVCP